mgnify:CR=1 FL=1
MGFQDKIESANPLLSEANWKSAVDANTGSIAKSAVHMAFLHRAIAQATRFFCSAILAALLPPARSQG